MDRDGFPWLSYGLGYKSIRNSGPRDIFILKVAYSVPDLKKEIG